MSGREPLTFTVSSPLAARDLASALTMWLRTCVDKGWSFAPESLELLRSARAWRVSDDTPLPQALPLQGKASGWSREYDSDEAAAVLLRTRRWVTSLAFTGELPARKSGRRWVFDAAAVDDRALAAGRPGMDVPPAGPRSGAT